MYDKDIHSFKNNMNETDLCLCYNCCHIPWSSVLEAYFQYCLTDGLICYYNNTVEQGKA